MNKLILLGLLCLMYFWQSKTIAQTQNLDCNYTLKNTVRYIADRDTIGDEAKKEIENLLNSCSVQNFDKSFIQVKLKYFESKNSPSIFQDLKSLAENGHGASMNFIGFLYKDGEGGLEQDFEKSLFWLEKSANLGNDKALYTIGYYYLKGLGIKPNYSKAVEFFEKSDYPMAKHWLAISYLYGYGVERNDSIALNLLKDNATFNSKFFRNEKEASLSADSLVVFKDESVITAFPIQEDSLNGDFQGKYIELDWAGEKIQRIIPIMIRFSNKKNNPKYETEFGENIISGKYQITDEIVELQNFKYKLKGLHVDHPSNKKLDINLDQLSFYKTENDSVLYNVVAFGNGLIRNWKEPLPPHIFYFNFQKFTENPSVDYQSIKLSPNPTDSHVLVSFEMKSDDLVKINIYNNVGRLIKANMINEFLSKGEYQFELNVDDLNIGSYILEIQSSHDKGSKILLKK